MKFLVSVLLLAACAAASASERKLSQDAGSETFFLHPSGKIPDWHDAVEKAIFGFNQFFHGTAPKPSLDQIHNAIFGFNQESTGRKLMDDAKDETFWPFLHGTAPKPSISQIHHAIFGFNADGSKVMPEAMAPAPTAMAGRRMLQDPAHSETFWPFLHGTAPKPSVSQIHHAIFGFNADGSKIMPEAMAPAPTAMAGRRLLQDPAHSETFWPFLHGTAPKPSVSQIHQAIFGFNADGSKIMPEAMAPAPSALAGRRLPQDPAHSETFFHGTAPKPSLSQIHQAIFGFNDDQAQSETFFHGTAPKPTFSQIHQAIFGFNSDLAESAKAPAPASRKLLADGAHDETFWPFLHGTAPKPSISQIHHAIFGFNADGSKIMPEAMAPAPTAMAGRRLLQDAQSETFFHGTAPKPSLDQIHQAIFGFNNDPAQSETFFHGTAPKPSLDQIHQAVLGFNDPAQSETFFHGTAPKPTYSQIHQAIFGFNSQNDVAPKALSGKAPAPMH